MNEHYAGLIMVDTGILDIFVDERPIGGFKPSEIWGLIGFDEILSGNNGVRMGIFAGIFAIDCFKPSI